jgi:hypothetical protein
MHGSGPDGDGLKLKRRSCERKKTKNDAKADVAGGELSSKRFGSFWAAWDPVGGDRSVSIGDGLAGGKGGPFELRRGWFERLSGRQ